MAKCLEGNLPSQRKSHAPSMFSWTVVVVRPIFLTAGEHPDRQMRLPGSSMFVPI